jgi:hypothetical protein
MSVNTQGRQVGSICIEFHEVNSIRGLISTLDEMKKKQFVMHFYKTGIYIDEINDDNTVLLKCVLSENNFIGYKFDVLPQWCMQDGCCPIIMRPKAMINTMRVGGKNTQFKLIISIYDNWCVSMHLVKPPSDNCSGRSMVPIDVGPISMNPPRYEDYVVNFYSDVRPIRVVTSTMCETIAAFESQNRTSVEFILMSNQDLYITGVGGNMSLTSPMLLRKSDADIEGVPELQVTINMQTISKWLAGFGKLASKSISYVYMRHDTSLAIKTFVGLLGDITAVVVPGK